MEISHYQVISLTLQAAKSKRLLDLGCGTGEHARCFASQGFEVLGVDASETAIEGASRPPLPSNLEFIQADLGAVERLGRGHFGAAVCLGNTLPYLLSAESISRLFIGLKRRLLPGSPFLMQVMNYERLQPEKLETRSRIMGSSAEGATLEVEAIDRVDSEASGQEGIVRHTTASLLYHPNEVPSIELTSSRAEHVRGWTLPELATSLRLARFADQKIFGDLSGAAFEPDQSEDIVLLVC